MADFRFPFNTDDSAVDELISQAQDLYILEQISAVNCASFTDSELSADLDSRFRRLKSFPEPINPNIKAPRQLKTEITKSEGGSVNFSSPKRIGKAKSEAKSLICEGGKIPPNSKQVSSNKGLKKGEKHGSVSSSSDSVAKDAAFSKPNSGSSKSWLSSLSPFQKCSSKDVSEKKINETKVLASALNWEKRDEFLSDLKNLPVKEQQKILKKTLEEQKKLRKEAAQMVKTAKKGPSRTSSHGCEDELSDS